MAAITIQNVKDPVWGNCVHMANGLVELLVTTDFGPRVISLSRIGMENMLHTDPEMKPLWDPFPEFNGDEFKLYGGHRLWISPEVLPRCYHPDNKPVTCTPIDDGMTFTAAAEAWTGVQKSFSLRLSADSPSVSVMHTVTNVGAWDIELALWGITMMAAGGKSVIPMPNSQTGVLHNRTLSLWDYSDMNDPRVYWGKDYITLTQDVSAIKPFKVGLNGDHGWGAYFNKGQLFVKYFEPASDGLYPDGGCSYESYTNNLMLESETLSEMMLLEPGESATHLEEWELHIADSIPSNDEAEISAVMAKYLV